MSSTPTSEITKRVRRLKSTQERMQALLENPDHWTNDCEEAFTDFRQAVVHLKNEQTILDEVEEKETICRFMEKFCRDRPPFQKRSEEVLKILLGSEAFKAAFRKTDIQVLPPGVRDLVQPGEEEPPRVEAPPESGRTAMAVVVERCTEARLRTDIQADSWDSIQQGLVITVSLAAGAGQTLAASVAQSLLVAKLAAASGGAGAEAAESVEELCRQGHLQGIVVVPQTLLIAQLGAEDGQLSYPSLDVEDDRGRLYGVFVQALQDAASRVPQAPKIVAGRYGDPQSWEIKSDGFMHSFNFWR